jgi:hypothetical protein
MEWEKPARSSGGMSSRPRRRSPRLWKRVYNGLRTERAVMSLVRRHPVITFFLLTYALSWAATPWQSFFAPGVLVAALIVVSLTEGVAGLKAMGSRLIRWRVSWI